MKEDGGANAGAFGAGPAYSFGARTSPVPGASLWWGPGAGSDASPGPGAYAGASSARRLRTSTRSDIFAAVVQLQLLHERRLVVVAVLSTRSSRSREWEIWEIWGHMSQKGKKNFYRILLQLGIWEAGSGY